MCELICKRFFSNYNAGVPIKMLLGNNNKTTKSNFLNNMYNIWFQVKISPKAVWLLSWLIQGFHRILKPPSFIGFVHYTLFFSNLQDTFFRLWNNLEWAVKLPQKNLEVTFMWNNNCGGNFCWIIILILLLCNGGFGCGNTIGTGCGCGCGNDTRCDGGCGCC